MGVIRFTEEEYAAFTGKNPAKGHSKYRNKKASLDGNTYDSKLERDRMAELEVLEKAGIIKELVTQPRFILQEAFVGSNGKKYQAITYVADFQYYDTEKKKLIVEDTKGVRTKEFNIKEKLFRYKYSDIEFVVLEDNLKL